MKKKKQYKEYDEATLKRIHEVELEILKDFMDICERHGLDYFGIAGTGIAASRLYSVGRRYRRSSSQR